MYNAIQWPSVAIASLSIRDFRGIASLDLDFRGPEGNPNPLVVLAGPNGCGKTAALEAVLFLVGGNELLVGRQDESAIRCGAKNYSIQATIKSGEIGFTSRHECSRPVLPLPNPIPHWYFSSWRRAQLPGPVDVTVGKPSHRPGTRDQSRLLSVKQRLVNAAATELFQKPLPPFGRYSAWMPVISKAWREFYPESGDDFAVELVDPGDDSALGSFDVYLRTSDGVRLEVDLLSAGQIELFLFLAELAMNESRTGIIFIDEPELHLDPQWHRLILSTLRRLQPRAQLVVATHSPEI